LIGRLSGILLEKKVPQLLIDVQGIGYEVAAPMSTIYQLPEIGNKVTLFTHLVVREDAHTLYGFASDGERQLFRTLIKISGVGAKLALTLLSGMSPEEFIFIIQAHDVSALVKLPGVGKKTAERLIVELSDKLEKLNGVGSSAFTDQVLQGIAPDAASEAVSALISLGYKPAEASRMIRVIENKTNLASQDLIRTALQLVGR